MSMYLYNHHHPLDYSRPSRLLNQHFGLDLEPDDLLTPMISRHHMLSQSPAATAYLRPWRSLASHRDIGSTVSYDHDHFEAHLDVQQFKPDEISVKVTGDNTITIEGKHEDLRDEHGYIARQFVRRYVLPKGHDIDKVESKLSSDGVLTVTAPKAGGDCVEHRPVAIQHTGQPSKSGAVAEKKESRGDSKL